MIFFSAARTQFTYDTKVLPQRDVLQVSLSKVSYDLVVNWAENSKMLSHTKQLS